MIFAYNQVKARPKLLLAMTGLTQGEFAQLLLHFQHAWDQFVRQNSVDRANRQRQYGGGRSEATLVTLEDKLLFIETVARAPGCPQKTFSVKFGSEPLSQEGNTMFGPGEYRPDPSAGITAPADLPQPEIISYSRNDLRQSCPRCGHSAYRDKQSHRTLHDLGNLDVWCPRDLLVTYSQHYCTKCRKYFSADLSDLAPPGGQYTHRVIDLAVRLVVEDGLPYRPASWHLWRDHRVFVPFATIQNWVEAGGKKGAGAHGHGLPGLGVGGFFGLCGRG